jgi:lipopolysaccharide transport system permease protein
MIVARILSPAGNALALKEGVVMASRHGELIWHMTYRELKDRYAGQMLGVMWALCAPLLAMAAYVFAFTFIFRQRLGPSDTGTGYTVYVLAGLVPWLAMSDVLSRAPQAVSANVNLVKQIVFPIEVLPLKVALSGLPQLLVGLAVVGLLTGLDGRLAWPGSALVLPAVVLFTVSMAGLSYLLAAAGVFVRDIKEIITFLLSIGLFLHPILYPPHSPPRWLESLFVSSPLSHLVWCFRDALVDSSFVHPWSWGLATLFAVLIFASGWRFFRMLQPTFGNAL